MECRALAASGAARVASQMIASSSSAPTTTRSTFCGRPRCGAVDFNNQTTRHRQESAAHVVKMKTTRRGGAAARRIASSSSSSTAAAAAAASSTSPPPLRMIVLRHSDSCTEDASLKDHDRPLTTWGRTLAAQLCRNLVEAGWAEPDLVLCSASTRSRETLNQLTEVSPSIGAAETHFLGSLYHFAAMDGVTADHLRETIVAKTRGSDEKGSEGGPREVRTVMCIGHNKGWEEAASDFAGTEVKLQVANAALLECDSAEVTTWEEAFASLSEAESQEEGKTAGEKKDGTGTKAPGWRVVAVVQHGVEPQEPPPTEPPMPSFEGGGGGGGGPSPMPSV